MNKASVKLIRLVLVSVGALFIVCVFYFFAAVGIGFVSSGQHIRDLLPSRETLKRADYDGFDIEYGDHGFYFFSITLSNFEGKPTGFYLQLPNHTPIQLEKITLEDLEGLGVGSVTRTGEGDGVFEHEDTSLYFYDEKLEVANIEFGVPIAVGVRPEGPFVDGPIDEERLIKIFGQPEIFVRLSDRAK